ncbi:hypothetical protein [Terrarubrum flagellatum]|uniref:LysM peptidoglycan-binding domain-containing protein n=1 Tax=Terrirubrum flagellatum TaxID=2895980 RepID=UPI00314568D9
MANPGAYFSDPAEKLIAETAWAVAANPSLDAWTPAFGTAELAILPWAHRQIVLARAWTTEKRETANPDTGNKDGGIAAMLLSIDIVLNVQTVKVTPTNIANVEHFFSSALISTTFGAAAGPVISGASSVFWEFSVGPYAVVAAHAWNADWSKQSALDTLKIIGVRSANGIRNNLNQLAGPDQRGIRFASSLIVSMSATQKPKDILGDYLKATNAPPRLPDFTKIKKRTHRVQGGEALSLIAGWFYNGEMWRWPVLYMRNQAKIGGNYNLIRPGLELEIPFPWEMTGPELETAKIKHRQWNREGRW